MIRHAAIAALAALALTATPAAAAAPAAAPVVLPNGVRVIDTRIGTGAETVPGKRVAVHYTGWLYQDGGKGPKFDSSLGEGRGQPFIFTLGGGEVIEGWDTGVAGMKVGGLRTLIIPASAGYGEAGAGASIGPGATLIFEIELLAVEE